MPLLPMPLLLLCLLHLTTTPTRASVPYIGDPTSCSATHTLNLEFLPTTTKAGLAAVCYDGSPQGIFIDTADTAATAGKAPKFTLWFGDSVLCGEGANCDQACSLSTTDPSSLCYNIPRDLASLITPAGGINATVAQCYFARVQCSSTYLNQTQQLTPETVLCRDYSNFNEYIRVFIPSCSFDWFVGRGTGDPSNHHFLGANIVDALLEVLTERYGFAEASQVIIGGTRGGAVGALNAIKYIKGMLNPEAVVLTVADSSWLLDIEGFSIPSTYSEYIYVLDGYLKINSETWINNARLDPDCLSFWSAPGPGLGDTYRCLMPPELGPNFLKDYPIFWVHSEYDLLQLSSMGILDPTAKSRFSSASTYTVWAIAYVEEFGSGQRVSLRESSIMAPTNHLYFVPACGQHQFLLPIAALSVPPYQIPVASAGAIQIELDTKVWNKVLLNGQSVKDVLVQWLISNGNSTLTQQVYTDTCSSFLCNPTCLDVIIPFSVAPILTTCGQAVVLMYWFLLMGTLWTGFFWSYAQVRRYRRRVRSFWVAFKTGAPLPDLGMSKARMDAATLSPKQPPTGYESKPNKPPPQSSAIKSPLLLSSPAPASSYSSPASAQVYSPPPPIVQAEPETEDDDEIDMVALATALGSKDPKVRKAAKKAYSDIQKKQKERKKRLENKAKEADHRMRNAENDAFMKARAKAPASPPVAPSPQPTPGGNPVFASESGNPLFSPETTVTSPSSSASSPPVPVIKQASQSELMQKQAEEELLAEAAQTEYRKLHLMVRDLSYWAPPRKAKTIFTRAGAPGTTKYQILRSVNLACKPGEVHALMGPSGSGKSTMLDIMALIRDSGEMSGCHYTNGVNSHSSNASFLRDWLRHNVSYVKQTDVLFPLMTVREHLTHAAWLLLPQFVTDLKKLRRVQQVIELLELEGCADTICGDGGVQIEGGISGGQRRRVSVATQLLRLPAALLLDEPTSGLDSTNALLLCKSLNTLAHRGGLTVVMTIHQPRNEIFALFDSLTILVGGNIVFSGPPKNARKHFKLERVEQNVANEILDKLAACTESEVKSFQQDYESGPLGKKVIEDMRKELSEWTPEMAKDLGEVLRENALGEGRWSWEAPASASMQTWVLMSRTMIRGGFRIKNSAGLSLFGGFVVGICFVGIGTYTSRLALCYLGVATMTFLQGAFLGDRYLAEKAMYDHESSAGSTVAWQAFLANQFLRDSITSTTEAVLFGTPLYWVGGMTYQIQRYAIYLVMVILIATVCLASNVMVEVDRDNLRAAALINVAYVGLGALFNGFIIFIDDLPVYFSWLPYIMVTYYGFAGILINDFTGQDFGCLNHADVTELECATQTGDVIIVELSFNHMDSYVCMLALMGMFLLFRSCTVANFYRKYVAGKGNGLIIISGGTSLEEDKQKGLAGTFGDGGRTMGSMLEGKGDATKQMIQENKKKQDLLTASINRARGGVTVLINNEWTTIQSSDKANQFSVAKQETRLERFFFSRPLWVFFGIADLAVLGVACSLTPGAQAVYWFFLIENVLFCLLFGAQAILSLTRLVPLTPEGPKDCSWAGTLDLLSIIMTLGDFAILVQLFTNSAFQTLALDSFSTVAQQRSAIQLQQQNTALFLALAGVARALRLIRVVIFWNKVALYHQVRADSWLIYAAEQRFQKEQRGPAAADANAAPGAAGGAKPKRPPRPPRPNLKNAAWGQTYAATAAQSVQTYKGPAMYNPDEF